jgi:starch phosphorylase
VTRAGNLFTTHTAVAAGFDRFAPSLIERYLGGYARSELGLSLPDLLALGRRNAGDPAEEFNMAYLAIRASGAVNGVSRLHGEVSRQLFAPLFPRWPVAEVPIGHVTNGIHAPTWDSALADALWTEACERNCWLGRMEGLQRRIRQLSDARLWQFRNARAAELVAYARRQLARQIAASGAAPEAVDATAYLLDPNALILGFGRRFATYKRPNLLLTDPERLVALLTNPVRPVQLVVAGKAHPADVPGQALIRQWTAFIRRPEIRAHVIFLADYDMRLAEHLVQGVDLWLNTPRRPWEACGTSGMKVLVNGGLNLSELDGWWAEAYAPEIGWALGDGQRHDDDAATDALEAKALYDLLEREVVPCFYARDGHGIPTAWVAKMRESMARLTPQFSSNRTVREYTERHYLPAAAAYRARAADGGAAGAALVAWRRAVEQGWAGLHFGESVVRTEGIHHKFEIEVFLHDLDPEAVRVELYADGIAGGDAVRQEMRRGRPLAGGWVYVATVAADRPATDFTARILPWREGLTVPLEETHILWQR